MHYAKNAVLLYYYSPTVLYKFLFQVVTAVNHSYGKEGGGVFAVHFKPGSEYRLKDQSSGCSIQMWYKCQVFLMEKHWLRCIKELYLHGLFYVSTSPLFIVILKDEDLCKIMEKLGFLSCCFPYYITLKFFKSLSIYFLADQYFWTNTEYRGNESP